LYCQIPSFFPKRLALTLPDVNWPPWWWCYPTPSEKWGPEDSAETKQSGYAARSGLEIKNERWRAGEAQMRDNPEGGDLDPAIDVHRRCMKNSSVLSCIDKRR